MDYNSIRKYKLQVFFSKIYTTYIVSIGCMVYTEIDCSTLHRKSTFYGTC